MELRQLEAFEAVTLHGSFTRAAEALHLTQPAVTRQIAALETELRTRLFDRSGRTVRLTASGEVFHRYAESIVRQAREARAAVAEVEAGEAGRLTVGASSTLAAYVLPAILRRFREDHPRVEIGIHTGVSAQVREMVKSGDADIGLVTGEPTAPDPALVSEDLADYETCVVLPVGHPLAEGNSEKPLPAAALAGTPLILMEAGTNLRTYVDRLLSAAGVEAPVTMEMDNVEAIKRMVEAGLGVSILPQVSVRAEVAGGRLAARTLAEMPRATRRIALVYRRDKYLSAALRASIGLLQKSLSAVETHDGLSPDWPSNP